MMRMMDGLRGTIHAFATLWVREKNAIQSMEDCGRETVIASHVNCTKSQMSGQVKQDTLNKNGISTNIVIKRMLPPLLRWQWL